MSPLSEVYKLVVSEIFIDIWSEEWFIIRFFNVRSWDWVISKFVVLRVSVTDCVIISCSILVL